MGVDFYLLCIVRAAIFSSVAQILDSASCCSSYQIGFPNKMELLTAVISGDRCFELRVFLQEEFSVANEITLTRRLCRLVDACQEEWKR